ncbi:MAG: MFS transporter [Candidatus Sericytochromatia bacterium]|nr:MFS transporter [Candidatus Sericytochromatia bacterium]
MLNALFPLLLIVFFLHGIFASGFIPILNHVLGTDASWAFAVYFGGLLLGQVAIYFFGWLSNKRWHLTFYEIVFGFSLILMGYLPPDWLVLGRGIEGLAGGLATPLLFAHMIHAPSKMSMAERIVRYNAVYALGYVLGPLILESTMQMMTYRVCLLLFGIVFIVLILHLGSLLPELDEPAPHTLTFRSLFSGTSWFEKFYSLFFAKAFYGFLLSFIASFAMVYFGGWPISVLTVSLAVIFVFGQKLGERTLHRLYKRGLEIILPLSIALTMLLFWATEWRLLLFVAALQHAYLLFIAFINFTTQISSGREFALFNSISDPGMFLGALLAGLGLKATWVLLALACLPLLYWREWPRLRPPAAALAAEAADGQA